MEYLKGEFHRPYIPDVPIGIKSTNKFINDIGKLIELWNKNFIN
jgi:nitrogenase molybdenum-iron protein alpha/beta subunit